jgi:hypothetical protein
MGFTKRIINKDKIMTILNESGLQTLISVVRKPDALFIEDEFSEKVCDIIKNTEDNLILVKLLEKTDLYGTNDTEIL